MKEVVLKTRKKITLIGTVLMGSIILLLVILLFLSNIVIDNQNERSMLRAPTLTEEIYKSKAGSIMSITFEGPQLKTSGFDIFADEEFRNSVIVKAVNTREGHFRVEDRYFVVQQVDLPGISQFNVMERTVDHYNNIIKVDLAIMIFIIGTSLSMIIIWELSKKIVKPIEESFIKQEELIANASHELKTPLAIVMSNISAMEVDENSTIKDNKQWIGNINSSVTRMNDLVLEMLELSKIENLKEKIPLEKVDLVPILASSVISMDALCFERGLNIEFEEEGQMFVYGNHDLMAKTFDTIIENAVKYTTNGNTIKVNIEVKQKQIEVSFINPSSGLSNDEIDHLFDRFYKSNQSQVKNKSFGLGLAIAKANMDIMKGSIKATSDAETFVKFTLTFIKAKM